MYDIFKNLLFHWLNLCVRNCLYFISMKSLRRHAKMNHISTIFLKLDKTINTSNILLVTLRLIAKALTLSHKITLISTWADEVLGLFTMMFMQLWSTLSVCVWLSAWEGTAVLPYMVGWGSTICPTLFPVDCSPLTAPQCQSKEARSC